MGKLLSVNALEKLYPYVAIWVSGIYIYLILLNIYNMNGSVLPTTARSQIKRGGGGGGGGGKERFGYVWLILGKDFKISQKIVSQS